MFEKLSPDSVTLDPSRLRKGLTISVAGHAIVLFILYILRIPSGVEAVPKGYYHVKLLTPKPEPRTVPQVHVVNRPIISNARPNWPPSSQAAPPAVKRPDPRVFQPPRKPAETQVSIPVVSPVPAAVMPPDESPGLALPHPALPQLHAATAPPLKTDNLAGIATAPRTSGEHARVIQIAGFGDADSTSADTSKTARATAQTGGFATVSTAATGNASLAPVKPGTFGDTAVGLAARAVRPITITPASKPVEILSKPRPQYSSEARQMQLEGEVLLEVTFSAGGEIRVVRLVRGLGHGLDESALVAARAIRFRPAERGGVPVDSNAIVHIVFQLAF